jgi:hypothetical protein
MSDNSNERKRKRAEAKARKTAREQADKSQQKLFPLVDVHSNLFLGKEKLNPARPRTDLGTEP